MKTKTNKTETYKQTEESQRLAWQALSAERRQEIRNNANAVLTATDLGVDLMTLLQTTNK
jgi:hypothetical protein